MQFKTRTWFLISLTCFVLAGLFWHLGNERWRRDALRNATNSAPDATAIKELGANNFRHSTPALPSIPEPQSPAQTNVPKVAYSNPLLTNRLSNTAKTLEQLMRSDSAVLLRNAFIDTSVTDSLNIPAHLRAQGDPGSYVVQSRGPLNDVFRARLKAAGASIVSYIPNNAYLVRLSEGGAKQMRAFPQTLSVLAWEPYYKLDLPLLALAVQNQPLPGDAKLNVLVFPGEREAGREAVQALGAQILGEDRSPFGHKLIVQAEPGILPALAGLALVQSIEIHHPRQLANDLTRPRIGVATNSWSAPDYLGLSGQGVIVNINDTGVDEAHPDLNGRVIGRIAARSDYDGHGTHVAGTIAGNGSQSTSVTKPPPGSATNGWDFRGMAPAATLFAEQIDLITGPLISDTYLQESAARTNAFISNNSWGYVDSLDYDSAAASYDAAVRDAIPGQAGPEPLLFVFAAGNFGQGGVDGKGGQPESLSSPSTAKNVITVGAVEKFRGITNDVVGTDGKTNASFFPLTDSDNQVAYYSSRGNVGIGVEGPAGRFKPDVVAPGSFVISCRADGWLSPSVADGVQVNRVRGEVVQPGATNPYTIFIPGNGVRLDIITRSNLFSPDPFPALPIFAKAGSPPDPATDLVGNGAIFSLPVTPGQWYFAVGNLSPTAVNYDLVTVIHLQNTNSGDYFQVLSNLNVDLAPSYRYESGTSQAAPAVSGMLALLQEFFESRLSMTKDENWPALMKAMLINGSRSMSSYSRQVQTAINYQGWGIVNLTNTLPAAMNGGPGTESTWPMVLFHTNTLYTGQSHTRRVAVAPFARTAALRFTLVWTDPPGNPAASLKLVNDLDLIVSNNIPDGEVYIGNNIPQGSDFNEVTDPTETNTPPADLVNNVENVFITRPVGSNYTVTVRAHRVNVNAVTGQTNGVLQDYALVIASDNTLLTNALIVSDIAGVPQAPDADPRFIKTLTNGLPLLKERVGANNPELEVLNNGVQSQWNFYIYENTTSFTNVAFVTFVAPNLARSRFLEADIDLYVTGDGGLLDFDPAVIDDCINWRNEGRSSRERGGTEVIIYTNALPGKVFYIGVKAEDQQAAEFGIFAIASNGFGDRDGNGNVRLVFSPAPADIPDGSPEAPQAAEMFAIVGDPAKVRRIVLTNVITHENAGDLYGYVKHEGSLPSHSAVLNNHRSFTGTQEFIYDDSREDDIQGSRVPDGPGRLRDFIGDRAFGLWHFTMVDNSPYHIGRVEGLVGYIEPEEDLLNPKGITLTVGPQHWKYATVDVPFGVTNMIVYLVQKAPNLLPLDLYVRNGDYPDLATYDKKTTIDPPGGSLSLGLNDSPGLQPGNTYYIGVYNPNGVPVTFNLRVEFQYSLSPIASQTYISSDTPKFLVDDAVTNSIIVVTNNRVVADLRVGLRIDHPRLSDLSVHLVSPQGARLLLTENRGGPIATNFGYGFPVTNVYPFSFAGGPAEVRTNIDTGQKSGVVQVNYDFHPVPDTMRIYYDGNRIFDSGLVSFAGTFSVSYGPGLSTVISIVMNEGGSSYSTTVWDYTATVTGPWNYTTFTDNPNLGGPIKFGVPQYYTLPTNRVVLSNSFESVMMLTNQTNFAQFDTFENWVVLTNGLAVLSDSNHPYSAPLIGTTNCGTNFLALSYGRLGLSLTNVIVPDHDYVLNFMQRKISSSPTQTMALQIALTADIYQQLNVTNQFLGNETPPQLANKVRLCPGQEMLVTAEPGAEGDTNSLVAGLPRYGLIGCFSFIPDTLTSNTVASLPFYIGTNAVIAAPADAGDYYLFLGVNNDDFNTPPTNGLFYYNVTASWQQCQYASGQVLLGGNALPITGTANWKAETIQFLANPTITNLVLQPDINTTLEFDCFEIDEQISTLFYLSEEPMTPFKGQLALGDWRLELWDNRAGAGVDPADVGTLLSWSLRFVFADSPTAVPLTNGVIYTNSVVRDQIKYFVVAVPNEVTVATNFLSGTGAGVELLYSPFGLPTGNSPPDPVPALPPGALPFIVDTTTPVGATLPRGRFYYLGVRNVDKTEINNFAIQVDFNIRVVPLPNGPPGLDGVVAANPYSFADIRANPGLAVTNMDYYYFDVGSTDIVSATIKVFPTPDPMLPYNGDINVVLRRALPVVDLFPRPTFFDYESTQPAFGSELIIVNSNSLPIKLAPGRWYVGIYNVTNAPAPYHIDFQQDVAPLWNFVDLTNNVPVPFTVSPFDTLTNFYRFVADQTNSGVLFEIYGDPYPLGGDADLLARRSDLPAPDLYDFSFLQRIDLVSFTWQDELIALRTNIFIPELNATNWFLQVLNRDPSGNFVSGWICAKFADPAGVLADCRNLVVTNTYTPGAPLKLAWNSVPGEKYAVMESLNLRAWTTAKVVKATGTKTSFTTPVPRAGLPRFYRIKQVPP